MNVGLKKAVKYIENGEMEKALNLLAETVETADDDTKFAAADIYMELGIVDKAKVLVEELLHKYPDEGQLILTMGEILFDLAEEDEAIEMLLDVKEDDVLYAQAQLLLADIYQLQGLDEVAEQKLLNAEKSVPDEPIVQLGLGDFYLSRGEYTKSIPYYKRALPFQNEFPNSNISLYLAEALSVSGYFEEALTYYQDGVKKEDTSDAHFGYGYTAFQVRDFSTAIREFETVIDLDEGFSSVYPYLGEAYEEEGQINEALKIIEKGISIDEFNEALYIQGARLSFNHRMQDKGEQYVRKALAINPANFEAANILANFLKIEERFEELLDLMEYLNTQGEEDLLFDWFKASALVGLDEIDEALRIFESLTEAFVHDSDFFEEYGQASLEAGIRNQAILILQKALEIDSTKDHLKDLLMDLENND